jgi:hypothetical protein
MHQRQRATCSATRRPRIVRCTTRPVTAHRSGASSHARTIRKEAIKRRAKGGPGLREETAGKDALAVRLIRGLRAARRGHDGARGQQRRNAKQLPHRRSGHPHPSLVGRAVVSYFCAGGHFPVICGCEKRPRIANSPCVRTKLVGALQIGPARQNDPNPRVGAGAGSDQVVKRAPDALPSGARNEHIIFAGEPFGFANLEEISTTNRLSTTFAALLGTLHFSPP